MARVPVAAPPQASVPRIRPARRAGRIGRVHVLQLLVVEALIAGVVMVLGRGPVVGAVAGFVAVVLAVATLARRNGRWWLEQWVISRVFRRRRAGIELPPGVHDDLAGLRLLAPGL